jgi:hypothetical protein
MADRWTLTVRDGPRVERMRFDTLGESMEMLERHMDELAPAVRRRAGRSPIGRVAARRFDPGRQVAVRVEVAGPGRLRAAVHGGVDLHGDGALQAYTGRFRRTQVELGPGESAYDALRRALRDVYGPWVSG